MTVTKPQAQMHKWTDVRGWGGALPGTVQCDRCNRVVSPTDPRGADKLESSCAGRPT